MFQLVLDMVKDIVMILFACVSANHLGLVSAIEDRVGRKIPVLNCSRCLSFWMTLIYLMVSTRSLILPFAMSFMNAYLASWLELGMGIIDTLYNKAYEKIYSATGNEDCEDTAVRNESDSNGSMPELQADGGKAKGKKNKN